MTDFNDHDPVQLADVFFDPEEADRTHAVLDVLRIRESWLPMAKASRQLCGHYHTRSLDDWTRLPLSGVVFATDQRGTIAALRVKDHELIGIMSLFHVFPKHMETVDSEKHADQMMHLWVDQVCAEFN